MEKYVTFAEKESNKSSLETKLIKRLEIIAIIKVNVEAQDSLTVI